MKQKLILLVFLALVACTPAAPTLVPVGTLVVQTMAALQQTTTPVVVIPDTPTPSEPAAPTSPEMETTSTPDLVLAAPGAQCVPATAGRTQARVTRVIDGDTIEVAVGNDVYTVRYLGINAPETTTSLDRMGPEATAENKRLVGSQVITLVKDTSDADQDGRLLRYVFAGDIFVNYELVRQGFAGLQSLAPDTACQETFAAVEQEAQGALLGVWAPTPIPSATATSTATVTPEVTPTPTSIPPCDCTSTRISCNSFSSQADAQACFTYCKAEGFGDVFGLDKNNNGKACEGTP